MRAVGLEPTTQGLKVNRPLRLTSSLTLNVAARTRMLPLDSIGWLRHFVVVDPRLTRSSSSWSSASGIAPVDPEAASSASFEG